MENRNIRAASVPCICCVTCGLLDNLGVIILAQPRYISHVQRSRKRHAQFRSEGMLRVGQQHLYLVRHVMQIQRLARAKSMTFMLMLQGSVSLSQQQMVRSRHKCISCICCELAADALTVRTQVDNQQKTNLVARMSAFTARVHRTALLVLFLRQWIENKAVWLGPRGISTR